MWKLFFNIYKYLVFFGSFFKGKIGIMKKSSQKFVPFLYIVIDEVGNKLEKNKIINI
jgi:hypothetical protein